MCQNYKNTNLQVNHSERTREVWRDQKRTVYCKKTSNLEKIHGKQEIKNRMHHWILTIVLPYQIFVGLHVSEMCAPLTSTYTMIAHSTLGGNASNGKLFDDQQIGRFAKTADGKSSKQMKQSVHIPRHFCATEDFPRIRLKKLCKFFVPHIWNSGGVSQVNCAHSSIR